MNDQYNKLVIMLSLLILIAGTCLAVGDHEGRISLWNQDARNEATPTFHKCLDVWTEKDLIAVSNMAWVCTSTTEVSFKKNPK